MRLRAQNYGNFFRYESFLIRFFYRSSIFGRGSHGSNKERSYAMYLIIRNSYDPCPQSSVRELFFVRRSYSERRLVTGLAMAALIARKLTVIQATAIAPDPASTNTHQLTGTR